MHWALNAGVGGQDMDLEQLDANLKDIRHLLSHLHGEVTALEASYSQVLLVLQSLEGVAEVDELSGLLRRGCFFQRWNVFLKRCQDLNENCGVLMIDIDHFKKVNDNHGHPTGDEVIKRVAQLIQQFQSPNCFAGRYGGEEFAIAYKGTDAEILGIAEMIRRGVERLHGPVVNEDGKFSQSVEWKCTLSVGMASARNVGFDASRLIGSADRALYKAKKKGRNQVVAA